MKGIFSSTFENKVDTKGRVSVPSQYRSILKDEEFAGVVLYKSPNEGCIEGCGVERLQKMSDMIDNSTDMSQEEIDLYEHTILGGSVQLPFDTDGRIIVPKGLLEYANISEKAIFVGMGQKFRVWEPDSLDEYNKKAQEMVKSKPPIRWNIK
jgi:MraZ protein